MKNPRTIGISKTEAYGDSEIILTQSNGDEAVVLTIEDARVVAAKILAFCDDVERELSTEISVSNSY